MKKLAVLWLFSLMTLVVNAQDEEVLFNSIFDEIFIDEENLSNLEEIYQNLFYLYQHPVNLNKATAENLKALSFLQEQQIQAIIDYREKAGAFISIYELQAVEILTMNDLRLISPFVFVEDYLESGEHNNHLIVRIERDLQPRKGYKPMAENSEYSPYMGTSDKLLFRLRTHLNSKVSIGLTMEKDAGENLIVDRGTRRFGLDYYSAYAYYKGAGKLNQLIIGDYQLQFGQGLVYSSGFSLGKSAGDIAGFRRISMGIRPHSSTIESGFMRGMAATFAIKKFKITGFISTDNADASIDETDNSFSNINHSGFHRTMGEIGGKDNLKTREGGLVVRYDDRRLNIGLGFSQIQFSAIWKPTDRLYNVNSFKGSNMNTLFNFMSYRWKNVNFFMEQAYLMEGGYAAVGGLLANLTSSLQSGIIARRYTSGFAAVHGNALGEKSRNSNETGSLWVISWRFKKKLQVGVYFDKFYFPWLSYQISQPSDGYEYLLRMKYNLSRKSYFLAQYKVEEKGQDVEEDKVNVVYKDIKRQYQMILHFPVTDKLSLRSRIQGSNTSLSGGNGIAIMQDISFQQLKYKLSLRYVLFEISDFDNRQYVYENDVLYAFNFPALHGKGAKFYLLFKYNVSKRLKVWMRYSNTIYYDREKISSGNEEIDGNKLTEVKLQAMFKI